jgi:DNA-binding CsgD family transcriptional regulator
LAAELGLTAREREVLEHLALGAAAIAHPLGLAPS